MPDMWMPIEDDPRYTDHQSVGERETLLDYLRAYRLTLELKCQDLDAEQMARRSVPPSTMSLLGLVRHLAGVEHYWFRNAMEGSDAARPFRSTEDRDLDFNGATADVTAVAEAWDTWRAEVAHAETYLASQDDLGIEGDHHGEPVALRDVLVHLIEEYARHCGHADLLRECVDGRTGQ